MDQQNLKTGENKMISSSSELYPNDRRPQAVYIAGPMRGVPGFNFPAFFAAEHLLSIAGFTKIFNPARRDNERYGGDISAGNDTGDEKMAKERHGFSLREALKDDTTFICLHATAIYLLPGWETSAGARAEWALANALGLDFIYQ